MNDLEAQTPSLSDLAFDRVLNTFESTPFYPEKHLSKCTAVQFFSRLNTRISPCITAIYIDNDEYWKRACKDKGKSLGRSSSEHCYSYKQMFFEIYMQEVVDSHPNDIDALTQTIKPFADYIHTLQISVPREFPIDVLCANLPNLSKLQLKLSCKGDAVLFQGINAAVSSAQSLVSLVLQDTKINDTDIATIFEDMAYCNIIHLDLSYNQISKGMGLLIDKFITNDSFLSYLDLSGNKIGREEAEKLGMALKENESLLSICLGLNDIGDEGGLKLFEGVAHNNSLRHFNVSTNKLGSQSARKIRKIMDSNDVIEYMDLANNSFSKDDFDELSRYKACSLGQFDTEIIPANNMVCLASEVPCSK